MATDKPEAMDKKTADDGAPPLTAAVRDVTMTVTRTVLGKQETTAERIKIRPFVTDPATVSVKFGATIPTVEYGSARVDIMMAVPCYVEEMVDVFYELRDLVDGLIDKEAGRLSGEIDDG